MIAAFTVYLGMPLLVILLWTAITAAGWIDPFLLPAPAEVLFGVVQALSQPETYSHLAVTLGQIVAAFLIAALVGVAAGVPIGWWRTLRGAYEPVFANLYAVPIVVLYPAIALMFGIGATSKIVFGSLYAFFPIVISTISAVALVDTNLIAAARSMGAGGLQLLHVVIIPASRPRIMTGLRLGLVLATLSVVGGQFIAGTQGLGYLLASSGQSFRTVEMFAYVIITLALAAALNGLMAALDHYSIRRSQ